VKAGAAGEAPATEAPSQEAVVSEAADGPVTVESARALPSVVEETDSWFAALSPDGVHLVYYTEEGRGRDRSRIYGCTEAIAIKQDQ
jgi:hypothetical protein